MVDKLELIPEKNNIRIKEQEGNYVIFNLETSGFHMLTADGNSIIEYIDGQKNIREVAAFFSTQKGLDKEQLEQDFVKFFEDLEMRRIIKLKEPV